MPRHSRCTCPTLEADWGAAERGMGSQEHATSPMPFASSTPNTGDVVRDVQASGKEARETPTKRQGLHEESDGAEESEDGKAVYTRTRTDGEGPSPLEVRRTKGGGAQSIQRTRKLSTRGFARGGWRNGIKHGCSPVDAAAMDTDASWQPHGE
jgi:hypothetical protein